MKDIDKLLSFSRVKTGDASLDEFVITTNDSKTKLGTALGQEGDNGKSHGQRGHKKAYLHFNFDLEGNLIDASVYVPSIGQTFTFLE